MLHQLVIARRTRALTALLGGVTAAALLSSMASAQPMAFAGDEAEGAGQAAPAGSSNSTQQGVPPAATPPAGLPNRDASTTLDEVLVTAQRRVEKLEDVPMTVTALSSAAIERRGVTNLQGLSQVLTSVQINFSGFATQPAIRGVSSLTTNVGFENNVAVFIDGFYQDDTSTINSDFANLQGIEVLKGPQGTLYGRNATGGAILITTLAPTKTFTGGAEAGYGNFNTRTESGYISGPITDRIRFSVAGYGRESDGYYDFLNAAGIKVGDAAPIQNYSFRTKLQGDVTDQLTATLAYNYTELSDPRGNLYTVNKYRSPALPAPIGDLYEPRTFASNHEDALEQHNLVHEGTITLKDKTPLGYLTSYTGIAHRKIDQVFDFDGSYLDLSFTNNRYTEDSVQESVDLDIDTIKNLDLIVGSTLFNNRVTNKGSESYSLNTLRTKSYGTSLTTAYAFFVDGSYHLGDRITLSAGARYSSEEKSTPGGISIVYPLKTLAAPQLPLDKTFSNLSPSGSIRYKLDEHSNVYASISEGFRTGLVQSVVTLGQTISLPVKPEEIMAYEVGYKLALPRLQFNTAAYYYDYSNIQVGITVPSPLNPAQPINVVSNAPSAEIYGAEADANWSPVDHLQITLGAAYTHGRYTDFKNATGNGLNGATNLNITGQIQDWSGQQMARAPTWTGTLGANYDIPNIIYGGSLEISGNVKYTDSYVPNNPSLYGPLAPAGLQNKQRYREPGYALVNSSLTWTDKTSHYKVTAWVNNLGDTDYKLARNGGAFGDYDIYASPRSFGGRIGYNF